MLSTQLSVFLAASGSLPCFSVGAAQVAVSPVNLSVLLKFTYAFGSQSLGCQARCILLAEDLVIRGVLPSPSSPDFSLSPGCCLCNFIPVCRAAQVCQVSEVLTLRLQCFGAFLGSSKLTWTFTLSRGYDTLQPNSRFRYSLSFQSTATSNAWRAETSFMVCLSSHSL